MANKPVYISFMADVNPLTAQALIGAVAKELTAGCDQLHLMISTGGGTVREGIAIFNLLRGLPIEVLTYNVGSVNSIGNVVYLSGTKRFASPTSSFMFHGVGMNVGNGRLEEKNLKELTDNLKNDQGLIADIIVQHTSMDTNKVSELFLAAAFIKSDDAKALGIVHDVCDIQVPKGAPFIQLVFQG